jgi:hypothetical protein
MPSPPRTLRPSAPRGTTWRAGARVALAAATALAGLAVVALTGGPVGGSGLGTDLDVRYALSGGPTHVDPPPDGVSLDGPTDTRSLYERAGQDRTDLTDAYAVLDGAAADGADVPDTASTTPPGRPSTAGIGAHVSPSCSGTGTDGRRVQPMYVREATTPSRYGAVLPLLLNEVANVDDVFAVSAARTGGVRRVRWVHDGACNPVLPEVVVPSGALSSFGATIQAVQALGYRDASRKYLMFAEADVLCGIGTLYNDVRPNGNTNDLRTSYARVDTRCWSGSTSVAAHELTHNLGGVLPGAPHVTTNSHCWDENDLMCYPDGSGAAMQTLCPDPQQGQLLDCGNDDYFSTAPPEGSWLATRWNTASSAFLDTTAVDPTLPPVAAPPSSAPPTQAAPTAVALERTKVRSGWHGRRGLVTGVLRTSSKEGVPGARLALQRRYVGKPWRTVARERTDGRGRVEERDRPRRTAYYRWVFEGSDQLAASRSSSVKARR